MRQPGKALGPVRAENASASACLIPLASTPGGLFTPWLMSHMRRVLVVLSPAPVSCWPRGGSPAVLRQGSGLNSGVRGMGCRRAVWGEPRAEMRGEGRARGAWEPRGLEGCVQGAPGWNSPWGVRDSQHGGASAGLCGTPGLEERGELQNAAEGSVQSCRKIAGGWVWWGASHCMLPAPARVCLGPLVALTGSVHCRSM